MSDQQDKPGRGRRNRSQVRLICARGHDQIVSSEQVERIAGTPCHVCGAELVVQMPYAARVGTVWMPVLGGSGS
jgi:hypothetical protein